MEEQLKSLSALFESKLIQNLIASQKSTNSKNNVMGSDYCSWEELVSNSDRVLDELNASHRLKTVLPLTCSTIGMEDY